MTTRPALPTALAALVLGATPPVLGAQEESAPASAVRLELEALDGSVRTRPATGFSTTDPREEGAVLVRYVGAARGGVALRGDDVARLVLANGDRLRARVSGGEGDLLRLELAADARLDLPVDALRELLFPARVPDGADPPAGADDADRLFVVTGGGLDRAEGFVDSFGAEGVTFEDARVGARAYPWERVAALFVAALAGGPSGGAEDDERVPVEVGLAGGGRLSGRLVSLDAGGVTIVVVGRDELRLPAGIVREVAVDDGSFRFLSDLPVADAGPSSPFGDDLGFTWPYRVDVNCEGDPMRVGGRVVARGIGVHAPSRLTWALGGAWSTLRLSAALDDSGRGAGRTGTVRFRVLGDGRELWASDVVRGGDSPVAPPTLDVGGVDTLVLEVDEVDDFVLDRANWLRPILVR